VLFENVASVMSCDYSNGHNQDNFQRRKRGGQIKNLPKDLRLSSLKIFFTTVFRTEE
jgi:hypothetical protein